MTSRLVGAALVLAVAGCGGAEQASAPPAPPRIVEVAAAAPPVAPPAPAPIVSDEVTITSTSPAAIAELKSGRALYDEYRSNEAEAHFRKAVELDPGFAQATAYLGTVTPGDDGYKQLSRALELSKPLPDDERLYVEGLVAQGRSDTPTARARFQAVSALKPRDTRVQLSLLYIATADESWDEVIAAANKIIAVDARAAPAYNALAYALAWQGHSDEAIAAAQQQVALLPDEPNPVDSLGEIYLAANRLDEAQATFALAEQRTKAFSIPVLGVGVTQALKGDWKAAHATFAAARDQAPVASAALAALYYDAWTFAAQGKIKEMLADYDSIDKKAAAAKLGSARVYAAANRAYMLALVGRPAEALKQANASAALAASSGLEPESVLAIKITNDVTRLIAAWRQKKPDDAVMAEAALEADLAGHHERSEQSSLDFAHGLLAWTQGDPRAAVLMLRRCSMFDNACRFLAVPAMRAAGDPAGAAELLAKLKSSPRRDGAYLFMWATTK